jgi:hypothetical protein
MKRSIAVSLALFASNKINAVCPICTIAVGAGVGFSRWLGIDDTISGLWIGGLTASLISWTVNFLTRHNIKFIFRKLLVTVAYLAIIIFPMYYKKMIGDPMNKLWGVDKILLGMVIGIIVFTISCFIYNYLKKRNDNRTYFPFLKILMPVGSLIVFSFIFYLITR